ncbi:AzlD domain-containing protein [Rhodoferax sp.]|uniref:AzlD domain-containing protein n=1 Tax=Rhodoferax sp. TaxID=50421 RepID=UPI002607A244|nr:AzlD domain-containing protein [Rhodoferax sp.]MDD2918222.1 AzlD domain-containing protein [Rhodoferax sp.]
MSGPDLNGTDLWTLGVIVGLALVTVITRCFFFMSNQAWHLPHWAQRGLQYAPIAALAAVVAPEVIMTQGSLITSCQDARIYAALVGAGYFFWRRGQGQAVLGTIVSGMAVYLPLHLGLGW